MRAVIYCLLTLFVAVSLFAQTAAPTVAAPAPLPDPGANKAPAKPGRAAVANATRPGEITTNSTTTIPGAAGDAAELQFLEGAAVRTALTSNNSGIAAGDLTDGFKLWHNANGPMAFATNNIERARIQGDGKMVINAHGPVGAPGARFSVFETAGTGTGAASVLWLTNDNTGVTSRNSINSAYSGGGNGGILIGMNTSAWGRGSGTLFQAIGNEVAAGVCCDGAATVTNVIGTYISIFGTSTSVPNGYGLWIQDIPSTNAYGIYQVGANDVNYLNGSVGIGGFPTAGQKLEVTGNVKVNGDLTATKVLNAVYGQDIAEWVPATTEMSFGTVVVLNTAANNEVMPSSRPYDTTVAGVVSEQPGITLGAAGKGKAPIATSGRVRVHVDATAAPIKVGDLLVSGTKPGTAMKSIPVSVSGIEMHRPGTLIGKALEPLASGEGDILVLLSMQ
jgi:hypothetical protein